MIAPPALLASLLACSGGAAEPSEEPAAEEPAAEAPGAGAAEEPPEGAPFEPDAALAAAIAATPAAWRDWAVPEGADPAAGEALYGAHCAVCHGVNGDGRGPAAQALPQPPADFTDGPRWAATRLGEKAWLIRAGIPKTAMPPRDLSGDELGALLLYIKGFQ